MAKNYRTYSGTTIDVLDPSPTDIVLVDICHPLSQICRFGGHTRYFYSVAQHCINVAMVLSQRKLPTKIQLYGLLHDAAEAYLCDVPRPIKPYFEGYEEKEFAMLDAIFESLGIPHPTPEEWAYVTEVDDYMLECELSAVVRSESSEQSIGFKDLIINKCESEEIEKLYKTSLMLLLQKLEKEES